MKKLYRPIFAFLAVSPFAGAALEQYLPAETFGIVQVVNVPKTRKSIESHPIAAEAGKVFDEFVGNLSSDAREFLSEKNKEKTEKVLAAFAGEALFAAVHTEKPVEGHKPLDFILLADTELKPEAILELLKEFDLHQPKKLDDKNVGDDDTDEKLIAAATELHAGEEKHRDVTLHTLYVTENDTKVVVSGWAVVNKTFVFATAPNVLKELVDARLDGRKENFTATTVYKANAKALSESEANVLANIPLIVREGRKALFKDNEPNMMGVDLQAAFDSLALDNFSHFRTGVSIAPAETRAVTSLAWEENKGLASVLVKSRVVGGELDLTAIPDGVLTAAVAKFDVTRMINAYVDLIKKAVPTLAPMLDMQIDSMKQSQGLDLRAGLLENFGDRLAIFQDISPLAEAKKFEDDIENPLAAMQPTVIVLGLKDADKFNGFIETALGQVTQTAGGSDSLFDEHEVLGVKVRTVKASDQLLVRYATHKGKLYIALAQGDLLNRVLAQAASPKGGIAENPTFRKTLARLQKNPDSVSYTDMQLYLSQLGGLLNSSTVDKKDKEAAKRLLSLADGYISVATSVTTDKSMESVHVLVPGKSDDAR